MSFSPQPRLPAEIAFVSAINDPAQVLAWSLPQWEQVVRQARRLRLLARLAAAIEVAGLLDKLPVVVARHLAAELRVSQWRTRALGWAITRVGAALEPLQSPLVLLKGAAYQAQQLPIAAGRLPSDLDILVPADRLAQAQELLADAGWFEVELSEHDRDFYLRWSHELPPMNHPAIAIELDVHHNILPGTLARVSAEALVAESLRLPGSPWSVLAPVDQLLHVASQIVLDGEPVDRVREVVDFVGLLPTALAPDPEGRLLERRAAELDLMIPLLAVLRVAQAWFASNHPAVVRLAGSNKMPIGVRWLGAATLLAITPEEPGEPETLAKRGAAALLRARFRVNRLPPLTAFRHLWFKMRA